jgi:starch synthase
VHEIGEGMLKAAIIRGSFLNWVEMLCYAPLAGEYEITAYASRRCPTDISRVPFPVKQLISSDDWTEILPDRLGHPLHMFFESILGYSNHLLGLEMDLVHARPDLVQTLDNNVYFSRQVVRAAERGSFRVIVTQFNRAMSPLVRSIKQEVNQRADRFMAITERAAAALRVEGVNPERIVVIPFGIDLSRFEERVDVMRIRRKLGIEDDAFAILYVGRLARTKGVLQLVYAAKRMMEAKKLNDVRFILAGDGPLGGQLRSLIAKFGLTKHFLFLGKVSYDTVPQLYAMADAFVLPSLASRFWQEQFGIVLVEAMASGLPILSTITGSIPEVVGEAGLLVQSADHLSLAEGLERIVCDSTLRADLRAKGRQRAADKYDSLKVAHQIKTLWQSLL